ncbi:MAG: hypothetical protein JO360_04175 [Acidobacteria bacterium]|nr:hypothetical protein [Acidobacteriota bacterium]
MPAGRARKLLSSKEFLFLIPVGFYFLWCAWDPYQWHFIDGANLVIHEAGHLIFMPFGEYVMIAGGSLLQVIMPALFVFYFYRNEKPYSAALVMLWAGESILNVSVYAGDAIQMQLPLLGGQDSVHDWNYLLERAGLLSATPQIAGLLRLGGTLVIIGGLCAAVMSAVNKACAPQPTEPEPEERGFHSST